MTLEAAFVGRLKTETPVATLLGGRVYQLKLPERPTYPAARVLLVSEQRGTHLRGPNGYCVSRVQVDLFANEYDPAHPDPYALVGELADAVDSALVGAQFSGAGSPASVSVRHVRRDERMAFYEPGELRVVRMMMEFVVWWSKS